jgi:sugar transferase (PEP-CTERM/EpsH1 system associated)
MIMSSPPLVLHVIHHLHAGGLENGLVNLVRRMPCDAFRHAIACVEDYSEFRDRIDRPDVPVMALKRSLVGTWGVRRQIHRLCRDMRPDILHTRNLSGLDAVLPARFAGVPHFVHGEHGWDIDDLRGESRKRILLRQLHSPLIDRYVTVSHDLRRYLIERVHIDPRRIVQIYNGVDTARFHSGSATPRASVIPIDFATRDSIVIGTVGRLQPVKDQATLLRAFARVVGRRPDYRQRLRMVIIGDGPQFETLNALAESLGIAALTWLTGASSSVPELVRCFDVFVLPSLNEGISNTILEAMASGVPVIATAVGGNIEIVQEGRWGRMFAPGDVKELSELIEAYVEHPTMRDAHGRAARLVATERFDLMTMVTRYQSLYESLLGRPSRASPSGEPQHVGGTDPASDAPTTVLGG